ncbi:hypothetical protein ACB092_05G079400 [Castanea dentata]
MPCCPFSFYSFSSLFLLFLFFGPVFLLFRIFKWAVICHFLHQSLLSASYGIFSSGVCPLYLTDLRWPDDIVHG